MLPRWRPLDLALLLLVMGVAAASRVSYVGECAAQGGAAPPLQVQGPTPALDVPPWLLKPEKFRDREHPTELDNLVHNLVAEHWFGGFAPLTPDKEETTAHVAPGYAWLLALIGGATESWDQAEQVMRWLQVGLGTLTAAFYFFFARRAFFSARVGFLA